MEFFVFYLYFVAKVATNRQDRHVVVVGVWKRRKLESRMFDLKEKPKDGKSTHKNMENVE